MSKDDSEPLSLDGGCRQFIPLGLAVVLIVTPATGATTALENTDRGISDAGTLGPRSGEAASVVSLTREKHYTLEGTGSGKEQATAVSSRAETVLRKHQSIYAHLSERTLNHSWWTARSRTQADEAATITGGDITADAYVESLVTLIETSGGSATSASVAYSVISLSDRAVSLLSAVESAQTRNAMRTGRYDEIKAKIDELRENSEKLRRETDVTGDGTFDRADERALLTARSETLRSLYSMLPIYVMSVHSHVRKSYSGASLDDYRTIRWQMESLRSTLIADYYATQAWLRNAPSNEHLAITVGPPSMPTHEMDDSPYLSRMFDTIETPSDYAIYRIQIGEADEGKSKTLRIRLFTANDSRLDDTDAYLYPYEEPTDIENPDTQYELTRRGSEKWIELTGVNGVDGIWAGEYYLLVKSTAETPYLVEAMLGDQRLTQIISKSVDISAVERGFGDARTPAYPEPTVTDVEVTPSGGVSVGDRIVINMTGRNTGGPADSQSLAVSFPSLIDESRVTILDHNFEDGITGVVGPGAETGARYGTDTTSLDHVLVEGSGSWEQGERRYLKVEVTPPDPGEFVIQTKSLANGLGVWKADPSPGSTNHIDQQSEYVYRDSVQVDSAPPSEQDDSSTPDDSSSPPVTFLSCDKVEIADRVTYLNFGILHYLEDGIDGREVTRGAPAGYRIFNATELSGHDEPWLRTVIQFAEVELEDTEESVVVENPDLNSCLDEIRPEKPTISIEGYERIDDDTIAVTFGYENPNDHRLYPGSSFPEGTLASEPDPYQFVLDPGRHTVTVEWTPERDDEVLVWQLNLQAFDYDDPIVVARTDPAGEVTQRLDEASTADPSNGSTDQTVTFLGCDTVRIGHRTEEVTLPYYTFIADGIDGMERSYGPTDGPTVFNASHLGGNPEKGVHPVLIAVHVQPADGGNQFSVDNPDLESCLDRVRPEKPTVSVEGYERIDDDTIAVTFGYENPNEREIYPDSSFPEGTIVSEPDPFRILDPGRHEFTVEWTPESDDEVLVWQLNLQAFDYDDPIVVARTEPAGEVAQQPESSPTTAEPMPEPTPEPTGEPTPEPTPEATEEPTPEPTPKPTEEPTPEPTPKPTEEPTEELTPEPTEEPTPEPPEEPTPA
ncbi:hypothetical protein [Halorarius halobius]|uniref:hypothetical protein n=1 Tax=Halorarius halobius TaxID=2962671 RepID=UPI0020CFE0F7|nr:hypothetical protein [Halorarius halobius]